MNRNSLLAAILLGSTVFGSFATMPFSLAQEESEIESTAPGSAYESIPEIEPAPIYEDPDPSSNSKIYDPKIYDGSEETTSVPQAKSTAKTSPNLVEVPRDTSAFNKPEQKVVKAIRTFEEFVSDPDINIPAELLSQSEGVIIIPDMVQAGFFFGGRRGTGVLSLRNEDGSWSNPAFVKMTGGSLGLQIGAKSSDLVLIFPKRSMVHEAFTGSYKLGGNVAGTAGSLGRAPVDSSQRYSKEKIYAYSRSSGLYGGVSLEGSELSFNSKLNEEFYGQSLTPRQIFANTYTDIPKIADSLSTLLSQAESGEFRLF